MMKLLGLLCICLPYLSAHDKDKGVYSSSHVKIGPVYTSAMKLFVLKNRYQMETCLRYSKGLQKSNLVLDIIQDDAGRKVSVILVQF